MTDWPTKPLKELCDPKRSIAYGIVQPGKPTIGGVPIVRVNNFNATGLDLSEVLSVDPAIERQYSRSRPQPSDVLVTLVGSIGQVAIAPKNISGWNLARAVGLIPTPDHHHAEWIAYSIRNKGAQDFIKQHANTTVQATFNLGDLAKLPVPYPDQDTREGILEVLSAIDGRIELNRRINETLEGMARAIFRDWFVDFGPVRRKAAGATDPQAIMGGLTTDPAQAATLAALFPAAFGADGLPVGWSRQTVERIVELAYGKSLPKTVRKDGPFPVYGSGGISGTHSTALVSGPGIIVGRKGTVGSLYWEPGDFFAIDTVFYVVPKAGIPLNFAWHLLNTLGLEGMNTDAAVPGLNRGNAYRLEFAFGGAALLDAFEKVAGPLRARQDASNAETQTLAETRDYLLPRLMSGAVRVVPQVEAA
ncbi:restriction endonuclease subunit S [Sphingomonas sp. 22R3R2A-7]|uniref:restriction endonuclease subunit S n=1 Tax=Sphingomonas sp. 22R3R2A-7 TaxID=3050230 RepID=UPI002FE0BDB9